MTHWLRSSTNCAYSAIPIARRAACMPTPKTCRRMKKSARCNGGDGTRNNTEWSRDDTEYFVDDGRGMLSPLRNLPQSLIIPRLFRADPVSFRVPSVFLDVIQGDIYYEYNTHSASAAPLGGWREIRDGRGRDVGGGAG